VVDSAGVMVQRERCSTNLAALLKVEGVPQPRHLVIEEGPLAGWLWSGLRQAR
jgi:hypothetical protein